MTRRFIWAFVSASHFREVLPIDRPSLPVPINSVTHLVPERNLVSPLHDTGTEYGPISYWYERLVPVQEPDWIRGQRGQRDELVPVQHFVSASCQRIQSYKLVDNGMNSYRYNMPYRHHVNEYGATSGHRDELVPVQHFVPASCKRIQSYKWAPVYELYRYDSYTGTTYRHHVNEYRATSGQRDELVPEWNSYRYHVNNFQIATRDTPACACLDTFLT